MTEISFFSTVEEDDIKEKNIALLWTASLLKKETK